MKQELRKIAHYVNGFGWYLNGVSGPNDPNCDPSDFLGANEKDAIEEIIRRDDIAEHAGV